MKIENIINGLKAALLKCDAITPENAEALESLLNNQVKNDIEKYTQQQLKGFCEYLDINDYYKDPYTGLKIHDFLKTF